LFEAGSNIVKRLTPILYSSPDAIPLKMTIIFLPENYPSGSLDSAFDLCYTVPLNILKRRCKEEYISLAKACIKEVVKDITIPAACPNFSLF
jgi:hypothetical protein